MDDKVTFSLSYEDLCREAETLIGEITALRRPPVIQDDMTCGELRGIIDLWRCAAARTGAPERIVYPELCRLQQLAGLPEGQ